MIVWAVSTAGASVVKTNTRPGQQETRRGRRAFFYALSTFVPGTIGLLRVQAIGVHPAPHFMLAAPRAERHRQSTERFHALAFQGDTQFHRRSRRVTQDHTEGIEPYNEVGPLRDRRMHALDWA